MNKQERAYYDILGIRKNATDDQVKKAFMKAALYAHPDKGGSDELMKMVNEAYEVLSDEDKRISYDNDVLRYNT